MELQNKTLAILGAGNLGTAIARGLLAAGMLENNKLIMTKRKPSGLEEFARQGITVTTDNTAAVQAADIVLICVQPGQLARVVAEARGALHNKLVISTLTGVTLAELAQLLPDTNTLARAMPNTALAVRQSMTCISVNASGAATRLVEAVFSVLGQTIVIDDELMQAATVLGASGIAFWMRLIRATIQGGIQLGFHAPEARKIAVQACLGAASLLLDDPDSHPEAEIDKVTTPKGCTIAGLNEMEHMGLSSALIKGIVVSHTKIAEI